MSDAAAEVSTKGLDQLLKALKATPPKARVGILGDNARSDNGPGNATIGAYHEFGTTKMPVRSFLRLPLMALLNKQIESSGALDKDVMADVIKNGTILPWMKKIAMLAEGIVLGAFDSGGYGTWASHAPGYQNNTGMLLVDTQQLRNSITTEVK